MHQKCQPKTNICKQKQKITAAAARFYVSQTMHNNLEIRQIGLNGLIVALQIALLHSLSLSLSAIFIN